MMNESFSTKATLYFESQKEKSPLYPFTGPITKEMIKLLEQMSDVCKLQIVNHTFIRTKCIDVARNQLFSNLAPQLPDMDFFWNELDEPRILKQTCKKNLEFVHHWQDCSCDIRFTNRQHGFFIAPENFIPTNQKLPLFTGATIFECFDDIIIPDELHFTWHTTTLTDIPWTNKTFKAVWRGSTTGGGYRTGDGHDFKQYHRQRLVNACAGIADCDAKFSAYIQCDPMLCNQMEKEYGPADFVPLNIQLRNKVIIDIDGNTYSARFPLLLSSGSVILKAHVFKDFATLHAKPWIHFIPFKMDMSDLQDKIQWAKENDIEVQEIVKNARMLYQEYFTYEGIREYTYHLLKLYSELLIK